MSEWTRLVFPRAHVKENVRLGTYHHALAGANPTEAELRALGSARRMVDALVFEPDALHLVEGKIRNPPVALVELEMYERLVPLTPELKGVRHLPIRKHLVWVIPDPVVEKMARDRGILVHVYHPPWVDEYLELLRPRERRPVQPRGLPTATSDDSEGET